MKTTNATTRFVSKQKLLSQLSGRFLFPAVLAIGALVAQPASAQSLTWAGQDSSGGPSDSTWNTTATDWLDTGLNYVSYADGDVVTFDDTAPGGIASTNVSITGTVSPASVTVNNSTLPLYAIGTGVIGGTGSLTMNGSGTLILSGANTFTGGVNLSNGTVVLSSAQNGTAGPLGITGTITFGGGTLQYAPGNVFDYSPRFIRTGGQTFNINLGGVTAAAVTYAQAFSGTNTVFNITNTGAANPGALLPSSTCAFTLSGGNTFSGSMTLSGGQFRTGSTTAYGNGTNPIIELTPNSQIYLNNAATYANPMTLMGYGTYEDTTVYFQAGALSCRKAGTILTGTITLAGDAGISMRSSGAGVTLTGQITDNGNGYGLEIGRCDFATSTGSGMLILDNTSATLTNNYHGNTIISDGLCRMGATSQIPFGAGFGNMIMSNGLASLAGEAPSTFDLAGFNQSINGLSSVTNSAHTSDLTQFANMRITNSSATLSTLTVGNGNASGNFNGVIWSNLALTKIGAGTETLGGANTYRGNTMVGGGTLGLSGSGSINNSPSLTVSNATLDVSGLSISFAYPGPLSLTNSSFSLGSSQAPVLSALNLTNSILQLSPTTPLAAYVTNIVVTNLNAGGTTNKINISALYVTNYPIQLPLIKYTTPGGSLATFGLGSLPAGSPAYQGYISNNTANLSIDLVLTTGPIFVPPPSPKSDVWTGRTNGFNNGNWDYTSLNWISSGIATNYNNLTTSGAGDNVTFDDTLTGTPNVNLTTNLSPASLTFNNTSTHYVFSGTGSLTGTNSLVMNAAGTLVLAGTGGDSFGGGITLNNNSTLTLSNTGTSLGGGVTVNGSTFNDYHSGTNSGGLAVNNFGSTLVLLDQPGLITGGMNIAGGTVLVGNNDTSGNLPTGNVTNNGVIVFNRTDSNQVASVISGTGNLTNNGSGTLNLSAAEPMSGFATVNAGTLTLSAANNANSGFYQSQGLTINNGASVVVVNDNGLAGTGHSVPVIINAGGTLTGTQGRSTHIHGALTLNGGTLAVQGTNIANQLANGSWDLEAGVTVPGTNVTAVISATDVIPNQAGGTTFYINPGSTPSGIDLLVTGSFINGSTIHDTGINISYNTAPGGVMAFDNNNPYTNNTTINGGTILQLGLASDTNAWTEPAGAGTINLSSGTLKLAGSQGVTLSNVISGYGQLLAGAGTNFLTASNYFGGSTYAGNSVLALRGAGSLDGNNFIEVSNATLDVSGETGNFDYANYPLSLTNGTLNLGTRQAIGPFGSGMGSLAISNSTVVLVVNPNLTNIVMPSGSLTTGGTTNLISITSSPGFPVYPTNLTLITYSSAGPNLTAGDNRLTTLGVKFPALGNFTGYLTNNGTIYPYSIQLVLLSGAPGIVPITWNGRTNSVNDGDWDILTTSNWLTGALTPYIYQDTSPVTFNDSLHGTPNVNLTTTVSPAGVAVNNVNSNYVFSGTGSLSGPAALTKTGAGVLTLAETGGDNFSGGIVLGGGSLVLSNTGVNISGGITVTNGTLTLAHGGTLNGGLSLFNTNGGSPVALVVPGAGTLNGGVTLNGGTATVGGGTIAGGLTNNAGNLTVTDAPAISGGLMVGGGTVLLDESVAPAGATTITNGTVQVGNNDPDGKLPSGVVTNNSLIIFNQSANVTVANAISGAGRIIQMDTNALTLSGANTNFTGKIMVTNGILRAAAATALGATNAMVVITNNGAFDVNGVQLNNAATASIFVSGSGYNGLGVIVNNAADQIHGFSNITMTADVTFGGTGRWDLRYNAGTTASLNVLPPNSPYKITKIGTNFVGLVNVGAIDSGLGNIDVQQGTFGVQLGTAQLGNSASNLFVRAGATLEIYQLTNALNKVIALYGSGSNDTFLAESGSATNLNQIIGPVALNNDCWFDVTTNVTATVDSAIGGPGNLIKIGPGLLALTNINNYAGGTTISNGTLILTNVGSVPSANINLTAAGALDVTGLNSTELSLASGQTLFDNGAVNGNVRNNAGAAVDGTGTINSGTLYYNGGVVSPGNGTGAIGALTVNGTVDMSLGGTTYMELNKTNDVATNDVLAVNGTVGYGGTLTVTNLGPALAAGDNFKLFTVVGSHFVFFAQTNLPPLSAGLAWSNTISSDGKISVVSTGAAPPQPPHIVSFSRSGTNLIFIGTNGVAGNQYIVWSSTNVALPLASWTPVLTNNFDGSGNFNFTNGVTPGSPRQFYILSQ